MPRQVSTDIVRLTRRRRKALTRISCQTSGEFRHVQRARILLAAAARTPNIATATSQPPDTDAQWTHHSIAEHLNASRGIGVSASQVGRILADADIKPHRVRGWLNRPDVADPR